MESRGIVLYYFAFVPRQKPAVESSSGLFRPGPVQHHLAGLPNYWTKHECESSAESLIGCISCLSALWSLCSFETSVL